MPRDLSLNFAKDYDLFIVVVKQDVVTQIIWKDENGGTNGVFTSIEQLPQYLQEDILSRIDHAYEP